MSEGFNINFRGLKLNIYNPEILILCVNLHLLQRPLQPALHTVLLNHVSIQTNSI
jgi:hypothetical protein